MSLVENAPTQSFKRKTRSGNYTASGRDHVDATAAVASGGLEIRVPETLCQRIV